jgi:hypothetical protein
MESTTTANTSNYSEMKRITMFQAELSLALRRITGRNIEPPELELPKLVNSAGKNSIQEGEKRILISNHLPKWKSQWSCRVLYTRALYVTNTMFFTTTIIPLPFNYDRPRSVA